MAAGVEISNDTGGAERDVQESVPSSENGSFVQAADVRQKKNVSWISTLKFKKHPSCRAR